MDNSASYLELSGKYHYKPTSFVNNNSSMHHSGSVKSNKHSGGGGEFDTLLIQNSMSADMNNNNSGNNINTNNANSSSSNSMERNQQRSLKKKQLTSTVSSPPTIGSVANTINTPSITPNYSTSSYDIKSSRAKSSHWSKFKTRLVNFNPISYISLFKCLLFRLSYFLLLN
jgi:hypothetical protein